jgi:tRNA threonylcarbamoyladenosine biosynthesis protein TsaB
MILSLDTATSVCSVALHQDKKLLACQDLFVEQSHSVMLTVMIDHILHQTNVPKEKLTAIAISDGPGSYTGLRVGSSVAKGLCYALDIPLFSVSTLQALASQMVATFTSLQTTINKKILLCPMLDARRMEVYTALYQLDLQEVSPVEAKVVNENSFADYVSENLIVCFGNGAMKCKTLLQHPNFIFIPAIELSAVTVGDLMAKNYARKVDVAYYEPLYLKEYGAK